jgi:hypothetical protein
MVTNRGLVLSLWFRSGVNTIVGSEVGCGLALHRSCAVCCQHAGCRGALDSSCNVQRAIDVHPMLPRYCTLLEQPVTMPLSASSSSDRSMVL